jgi:hypothetical protein
MTDDRFRAAFEKMTPSERARYGSPDEWQLEGSVGPRPRSTETAQFSLRIARRELEALRNLAAHKGVTFSELVREAIASQLHPPAHETHWRLRITSSNVREISYRSDEIVRDRTSYAADRLTSGQPETPTGVPQSA